MSPDPGPYTGPVIHYPPVHYDCCKHCEHGGQDEDMQPNRHLVPCAKGCNNDQLSD